MLSLLITCPSLKVLVLPFHFIFERSYLFLMLAIAFVESLRKLVLLLLDLVKMRLLLLQGQLIKLNFHSFLHFILFIQLVLKLLPSIG